MTRSGVWNSSFSPLNDGHQNDLGRMRMEMTRGRCLDHAPPLDEMIFWNL